MHKVCTWFIDFLFYLDSACHGFGVPEDPGFELTPGTLCGCELSLSQAHADSK